MCGPAADFNIAMGYADRNTRNGIAAHRRHYWRSPDIGSVCGVRGASARDRGEASAQHRGCWGQGWLGEGWSHAGGCEHACCTAPGGNAHLKSIELLFSTRYL